MERVRELTKSLLAGSFKVLMKQTLFEHITIKMITDNAGVIRPTFYNHFHDKYELMAWIVQEEILDKISEKLKMGQIEEAVQVCFEGFYAERDYYRKCFEVTGQNGFADTLNQQMADIMYEAMEKNAPRESDIMQREVVARYYASGLLTLIREVVTRTDITSANAIADICRGLAVNSVIDYIAKGEKS